ncbi:agip31 [Agrotis ipsilon multiple nucleopolyhedrovirus]|uniref:Protein tyrosine phosphatase-2 n=1 Tax=Agrotis ipsilon multiple nucleopolyhedrovirus TaxID=208013 RepID=B6D5U5_9ABAC|nr:agip31 [Agrotis ipsilon multiple nucleopolyhedrovirus]ACI28733.1 protein tyrosine phosphatase-2 [Agrotis ipsilon multiple nucleopolyhedrovirus]
MHTKSNLVKLADGQTINVSPVTERIYLGGIVYDAECLKRFVEEYNIGAIVSIWDDDMLRAQQLGIAPSDYLYIYAHDDLITNIMQHFETVYNFIRQKVHDEHKNVYVHCHAGLSRSATVLIYYLMKHYGIGVSEAYRMVNSKRRIRPNDSFLRQLQMAESSMEF